MKGTPNAFQVETVRPKERERRRLLLQKSPLRQNIAGHLEILLHRFVGRLIVEHDERVLLPRQPDQPAVHAAGRQPVVQLRRLMLFRLMLKPILFWVSIINSVGTCRRW